MASTAAELLLIFTLLYFGAFVREATASKNFPLNGTLFAAFSRSSLTLFSFFIALCCPAVASFLVAVASMEPILWFGTIVIFLATFFVHRGLQSKMYFDPFRTACNLYFDKFTRSGESLKSLGEVAIRSQVVVPENSVEEPNDRI